MARHKAQRESSGSQNASEDVTRAVTHAHRQEWAFVLAAAARWAGGDLHLAEEATQDAFVAALQTWPERGVPRQPGAWLTTAARHRVTDLMRRETRLRQRLPLLVEPEAAPDDEEEAIVLDDRLRLVFTCCHPALATDARVALTLRMVGGLTTAEIATGFLVSEATMAARITRAKKKISIAGIPFEVPSEPHLAERLDGVLAVIHLVFTAGHTAPSGDRLVRADLVERALDLARVLTVLLPEEPEVLGLLSLLLLTDARRASRTDDAGNLVLLADQDRARWDRSAIEQGLDLLTRGGRALPVARGAGRYLLQAGIAAVHAESSSAADTDWAAVVSLYDRLLETWPSPVVAMNRAVALGFALGPQFGLAALDQLVGDPALSGYHYLPAARADLLMRLGQRVAARQAYEQALASAGNGAEREFLKERLRRLA